MSDVPDTTRRGLLPNRAGQAEALKRRDQEKIARLTRENEELRNALRMLLDQTANNASVPLPLWTACDEAYHANTEKDTG